MDSEVLGSDEVHSALLFGDEVDAETGGLAEDAALSLLLFVRVGHRLHGHDVRELDGAPAHVPLFDEPVCRDALQRLPLVAFIHPFDLPDGVRVWQPLIHAVFLQQVPRGHGWH